MIDLVSNKKQILFDYLAVIKPVPAVPDFLNVTFLLPGDEYLAVKTWEHFFYFNGRKNSIIVEGILKIDKLQICFYLLPKYVKKRNETRFNGY